MGFFTKGIEYNKLAMAFNGIVLILDNLDERALNGGTNEVYEQIEKDVILVAYMYRINIIDRIEKYKWSFTTPIKVPNISSNLTTLSNAYNNTFEMISNLAHDLNVEAVVKNILEKGESFNKLEQSLPSELKNKLNEGL